ncbi:nuclear transcription factor Y subunit A-3-like [Camellia sinensis]|uniref:Nuclear transcription factor Y subunit n=1 Tax=Camellia sinensis var. sinensis TaxID=542762 RepID=A0A4S4E9X2_CAMSN|nr:nuclear transcription factor Y subunit A-3-like [Camellia sinensis]XP_028074272.1 nuclear transcription factor Y subunit A-3-like [Camellia sinensis]THG12474.1 hypothetical protein TEA_022979 [Camellia sinensis var. sinensis]
MSHFAVNHSTWWNSHEDKQKFSLSLSKNLSLKVESLPHICQEAKHLGIQEQDRDSSSTRSTGPSHHEVTAMGGTNSQDQCISSESVRDGGYEKHVEGQMTPIFFMGRHPDFVTNPSQVDFSQSINHISYPYADPYYGGLFTTYGPQTTFQPQTVGMAPARVPLPLDLTEDGPIYVNAKQYHGILRRRQTRAKLEARNKLVKARRPYLHESRHLHAVNRVRGSGGRFLSTKKHQEPDLPHTTGSQCIPDSVHSFQKGDISQFEDECSITGVTDSDIIFRRPDRRFSAISPPQGVAVLGSEGLMCNGTRHCDPFPFVR